METSEPSQPFQKPVSSRQSFLQWVGLIFTLVSFLVYAERRISTIEIDHMWIKENLEQIKVDIRDIKTEQQKVRIQLESKEEREEAKKKKK